jgi:molybdopterin converting factor small subunit
MTKTPTRLVHNQCVATDLSHAVSDGDEIAFLPPMSGG